MPDFRVTEESHSFITKKQRKQLGQKFELLQAASDKLMTTKITKFVHLYNSDVLLIVILIAVEEVSFFTDLHIG